MSVGMYACKCVSVSTSMCACVYVCERVCVWIWTCVCVCVCLCVLIIYIVCVYIVCVCMQFPFQSDDFYQACERHPPSGYDSPPGSFYYDFGIMKAIELLAAFQGWCVHLHHTHRETPPSHTSALRITHQKHCQT